jgi:hypothetical protein
LPILALLEDIRHKMQGMYTERRDGQTIKCRGKGSNIGQ